MIVYVFGCESVSAYGHLSASCTLDDQPILVAQVARHRSWFVLTNEIELLNASFHIQDPLSHLGEFHPRYTLTLNSTTFPLVNDIFTYYFHQFLSILVN